MRNGGKTLQQTKEDETEKMGSAAENGHGKRCSGREENKKTNARLYVDERDIYEAEEVG